VDQDRISEYFTGIKSTCELRTALSVNDFRIEHTTGSTHCEFLIMYASSHTAEHTRAQVALCSASSTQLSQESNLRNFFELTLTSRANPLQTTISRN
jgi:hypothetical protein